MPGPPTDLWWQQYIYEEVDRRFYEKYLGPQARGRHVPMRRNLDLFVGTAVVVACAAAVVALLLSVLV